MMVSKKNYESLRIHDESKQIQPSDLIAQMQ